MSGSRIREGQRVFAFMNSANRDPEAFDDPERFDIGRPANPHVTFGHGIHFCLGAPLARLESKIALDIMLDRLSNIQRNRDIPLEPVSAFILYGVKHMPIVFKR